jgi:hypothetical protein
VIIELDHDSLFAAGNDTTQTELLVLDLGALREHIGGHNFSVPFLKRRWREVGTLDERDIVV